MPWEQPACVCTRSSLYAYRAGHTSTRTGSGSDTDRQCQAVDQPQRVADWPIACKWPLPYRHHTLSFASRSRHESLDAGSCPGWLAHHSEVSGAHLCGRTFGASSVMTARLATRLLTLVPSTSCLARATRALTPASHISPSTFTSPRCPRTPVSHRTMN